MHDECCTNAFRKGAFVRLLLPISGERSVLHPPSTPFLSLYLILTNRNKSTNHTPHMMPVFLFDMTDDTSVDNNGVKEFKGSKYFHMPAPPNDYQ